MEYANILTGGIACGKSVVAKYLMLEGFNIIDADKIAHLLLESHSNEIIDYFGNDIVENNIINRKKLGEIIFNNLEKKAYLESILHPLIHAEITKQCEILECKKKPFFVEIPLYFESKFKYNARFVICVYASQDLQLQRIMDRDKLKKDKAMQRINSQIDIEIKKNKSDFIIDNSSNLKSLETNINNFLESFKQEYGLL